MAILQGTLLVVVACFLWSLQGRLTAPRFVLVCTFEIFLVIDWFRVWAGDWFTWILYRLRLGDLCEVNDPCYLLSGEFPWLSLLALALVLVMAFRREPA